MIKYEPIPLTSHVYFSLEGSAIGKCDFWFPEGISTPRGLAGVYPHGMRWQVIGNELRQEATVDQAFGPGNVREVAPGVLECEGVRYVRETALPWKSTIKFHETKVDFSLSIHNPGDGLLPEVGAELCFRFMDKTWWKPDSCFMATAEGIKAIPQTGWISGKHARFQKWNVGADAPYDNQVQNGIWTSNPVRAVLPVWVVRHEKSGLAVVFSCESAYYIHCNKNNPCNDIALKFGDLKPKQTITRGGRIEFIKDSVENIFNGVKLARYAINLPESFAG